MINVTVVAKLSDRIYDYLQRWMKKNKQTEEQALNQILDGYMDEVDA